jgi:hypothetical protein
MPQSDGATPLSIEKELHHTVAFENERVRVFHLQLQPGEVMKTHRHSSLYAYFSLQPATISNEVAGRPPVVTQLEPGELRTSKGGFNVAERNKSSELVDIFVIRPLESTGVGFTSPLAIRLHDAGIIEQYAGPTMRAYELAIASGGRLDDRTEAHDSLLIALTNSKSTKLYEERAPQSGT